MPPWSPGRAPSDWLLGLTDGLDFEARARWPLDPAAEPALGAGKQGAKA